MTALDVFLKLSEVAQRLGVCRRTVERMIAAKELLGVKVRGATRVPESALRRYLSDRVREGMRPCGG